MAVVGRQFIIKNLLCSRDSLLNFCFLDKRYSFIRQKNNKNNKSEDSLRYAKINKTSY